MNENVKTVTFVVVAVAVASIAWVATRPSLQVVKPGDMRGEVLFAQFDDPLAAASLEVVKFDESTATVSPFKVAEVDNRWSIPSHDNYPADAKDHLAEAATGLVGLKVLDTASDNPGYHELYGVVDPDPERLSSGATGVGTRVIMRDKQGKLLLALVVGKQVPDQDGLRYVRVGDQRGNKIEFKDPVYTVAVKTDKLSTKFQDWIEEDLLKLNSWDITQIEIQDYSVDELAGRLSLRRRMRLDYNDTGDPKWKMAEDMVFDGKKWVPKQMAENEELNTEKLDEAKRALDDLEIVDVSRKPEGLSTDLKASDEFINNPAALESLESKGFYRASLDGRVELFSNEGEIRCLTKQGVKYILRFGQIAGSGSAAAEKTEEGEEADGSDDGGVNRYLFVMAEFDDAVFEKPELEPLPEKPKKTQAAKPEKTEKTKESDGEKPKAEEPTSDEKKAEGDKKENNGDEANQSDEEKKYQEEVERIEKENKRKQEEYDKKIKEGKDKVKELNDRFANWYYIISDKTYQKIHLSRPDIVKQKEKTEDDKKDSEQSADEMGAEAKPAPEDKPAPDDDNSPAAFEALKSKGLDEEE